ncbi:MAG: mannose-6-phosphate isomerase, class I [Flavobacteriales bacterium]|nr:mannose-6-phosphate isomerase, class I [Flavobacteriales bacterium]
MKKVFGLKGHIQHYAWGGQTFIPRLLGLESSANPYAEYWLGAHENAPSLVQTEDREIPLDTFLNSDIKLFLGEETNKKFGLLPFLFKVLDVHQMLSIQVHPSKIEAEKGFKKENKLGIPLNAPNRNYKDKNHKPEIMVALGEFWLLHGFLPKRKLINTLEKHKEFQALLPIFLKDGYKGLYQYVMELPPVESDKILQPLVDRILPLYKKNKLLKSSADYWAAKAVLAHDSTSIDKGVFSIYFFNLLKLEKGEAIFQDSGVPHAYLEGQNMELMANSDNVLRGGLTQKHIDVPELIKHVDFEETIPHIFNGTLVDNGIERKYICPAPDFELSEVIINQEHAYNVQSTSVEIYILMEGEAEVIEKNTSLQLKKGESFLALADAKFRISTLSDAVFYKATTPQ